MDYTYGKCADGNPLIPGRLYFLDDSLFDRIDDLVRNGKVVNTSNNGTKMTWKQDTYTSVMHNKQTTLRPYICGGQDPATGLWYMAPLTSDENSDKTKVTKFIPTEEQKIEINIMKKMHQDIINKSKIFIKEYGLKQFILKDIGFFNKYPNVKVKYPLVPYAKNCIFKRLSEYCEKDMNNVTLEDFNEIIEDTFTYMTEKQQARVALEVQIYKDEEAAFNRPKNLLNQKDKAKLKELDREYLMMTIFTGEKARQGQICFNRTIPVAVPEISVLMPFTDFDGYYVESYLDKQKHIPIQTDTIMKLMDDAVEFSKEYKGETRLAPDINILQEDQLKYREEVRGRGGIAD